MISRVALHVFKIILILIGMSVASMPALAIADFYVIAGGGRMTGKEITSLPYTISSPGFYYITKDLTTTTHGHGIHIQADNVTIDLMGFSLIGQGGTERDGNTHHFL